MELNQFVSTLWQSRTQAHIFHHQTQGVGSFSEHKALNNYYEEIVPLVDGFVESVQGKYGIILSYSTYPLSNWSEGSSMEYFHMLCGFVEDGRKTLPQDTYIQNQIDEIVELLYETKYLLTLK
jgi:hypothetical protein